MEKKCRNCNGRVPPSLGVKPRTFCSKRCARLYRYKTYYRDTELKRSREWRKANPDKYKECKRNWYANNKDKSTSDHKNWQLKRDWGITLEEYEAQCATQENKCDICQRDPGKWKLRVDHCHKKNLKRGLLCNKCNLGLGLFKDSPMLLLKAARYLMNAKD